MKKIFLGIAFVAAMVLGTTVNAQNPVKKEVKKEQTATCKKEGKACCDKKADKATCDKKADKACCTKKADKACCTKKAATTTPAKDCKKK